MSEINSKRDFIRHPSDIPIEYTLENISTPKKEKLQNVSIGGISLQSSVYIAKGTLIEILIPIIKPPFRVKGVVVWNHQSGENFDVGIKFMDSETAFRARMVEQICYIEHYRKEVFEKEGRKLSAEEAAIEWINKYADEFPEID